MTAPMRIAVFSLLCLATSIHGRFHHQEFDSSELFHYRRASGFTADQRYMQKQALDAHNLYRTRHCVPSLVLDEDLNRSAQKYAEQLAQTNQFDHSDAADYGENLFMRTSSRDIKKFDGAVPVTDWYDEIKFYDFKNPQFSPEVGHFTQLVWKDSQKLGMGFATATSGGQHKLYVVAHYLPPGNEDDGYEENVLPARC